jgi:alpha-amylase
VTLQTTLPAGVYCDVTSGDIDRTDNACTGVVVRVWADGTASMLLPAPGAIALHVGARLQ